jgi:hypothetical protein
MILMVILVFFVGPATAPFATLRLGARSRRSRPARRPRLGGPGAFRPAARWMSRRRPGGNLREAEGPRRVPRPRARKRPRGLRKRSARRAWSRVRRRIPSLASEPHPLTLPRPCSVLSAQVLKADNLPDRAYLSIRAGDVRKQAAGTKTAAFQTL